MSMDAGVSANTACTSNGHQAMGNPLSEACEPVRIAREACDGLQLPKASDAEERFNEACNQEESDERSLRKRLAAPRASDEKDGLWTEACRPMRITCRRNGSANTACSQ